MRQVVLVTGGSRSGKSREALNLSASYRNRAFIATAEATDDEMRARIERHRHERGLAYFTVEEPVYLAEALEKIPEKTDVAVVDCMTVWLGNLFHRGRIEEGNCPEIEAFLHILESPPCDLILVTNEVGMGIVPSDAATRRFRDLAGELNQQLAQLAHKVILTVSGIAVRIK